MQDIRVWGDVNQLDIGSSNKFALHQAWGEYFLHNGVSIKLGRQELVYDDSRIFGNVGWAQQARAHDLGLFKYESSNLKLHIGFAFNQKKEALAGTDYYADYSQGIYTLNNNYKSMQFAWLNTKILNSNLSLLFLNNGMESVENSNGASKLKTIFSQTIGGRFTPNLGPVQIAAAAYYQMGKVQSEITNLSAMYLSLAGTSKINGNITFVLGAEYLSGTSLKDKMLDGNKIKSFTPLYGTNHKFNGHMDYFFVGNHSNNVGLVDIYSTISYKINKWNFFATPHYFRSAAKVYSPKGSTSTAFVDSEYEQLNKNLGLEIDLGITYSPQKEVSISLGFSEMFGNETLAHIQGKSPENNYSKTGSWAYLMFTFSPTFYSSK